MNAATHPPAGPGAAAGRWLTAPAGLAGGAAVGVLGGLVGLGGAEFRLPLLLGVFGFAALAAVIVNKAMSLVVVMATATLYRVLAVLLVFIAIVFTAESVGTLPPLDVSAPVQLVAGIAAGFGIGVVAALISAVKVWRHA